MRANYTNNLIHCQQEEKVMKKTYLTHTFYRSFALLFFIFQLICTEKKQKKRNSIIIRCLIIRNSIHLVMPF